MNFMIAHVQCKKDSGEIMGNTVMSPIQDMLNNICAGIFIGRILEDKT